MKARLKTLLAGSRSPHAGSATLVVVALVMALLATLYRGVPIANVQLHDGGVWVTNQSMRLLGHLNYPSKTLDGGMVVPTDAFDVHQHGNNVLMQDTTNSAASVVDVAGLLFGQGGRYPADMTASYGADTVAVIDSSGGRAWAFDFSMIGSFSPESTPLVEEVPGVRGVVTVTGDLVLVTTDGKVQTWQRQNDTFVRSDRTATLKDYRPGSANLSLSAVGDELVALDGDAGVLHTSRGTVQLPETDQLVLQAVGPESDQVAVSGPGNLYLAPLRGGQPTTFPAGAPGGVPSPPMFFQGCSYAAWAGSGAYVRDCPKPSDDVSRTVPRIASAKSMVFRTNRDVIVLNDIADGLVLLVNQDMIEVNNWQQVQAELDERKQTSEQIDGEELVTNTELEKDQPPVAHPDSFGVRPGRANLLPVLANDEDPDGDILTATVVDQPSLGPVQPVSKGEALQVNVPDKTSGTSTFSYQADDGRGGTSRAQVTLTVHDWAQNAAPKLLRQTRVSVVQGGTLTYNVLPDWYDPDGDLVYVQSAGPVEGMAVEARPDGTLTLRDLGTAAPGIRQVPVTVTDGRETATGDLVLDVHQGNRNVAPVANADHVVARAGQPVIAHPLMNDTDANEDRLRLVSVESAEGVALSPDYAGGTVGLSGATAGSYYLVYTITDGKAEASGLIRLDVVDPGADGLPPAAVSDLALLPPDSSTLVDLTANDADPMGGVLVVQSVTVDKASALSVQLLDHHLARIAAPTGLSTETTFSYTVSNGFGQAEGQVLVVPLPAVSTDQPPVALDDGAIVRAGDVATVDVLANDSSPAHLQLSVDPRLEVNGEVADGVAFVSDNKLRFRAGIAPGTVRVTYTVHDTVGGFASATATFTVVSMEDANDPPKPNPLSARALAGMPVRIPIPQSGMDPDGDSVTISGLDAPAPTKGAVSLANGQLEYTPAATASGTDVFGYTVVDRFGAAGTGLVFVGIAPAPTTNQSPFATADSLSARPERLLAVPVTTNDIDPDGDRVLLIDQSVVPVDEATNTSATVKDNRVELTTPAEAGVLRYYYDISDGRGGVGKGVLTVDVSPTAPLLYPIARDDAVTLDQIADQTSVTVDVLVNDEDPDGASGALALSSDDPGVTVSERKLVVPVTEQRQVVVYSVTDPDNQVAKAVVIVPGTSDQRPTLVAEKVPAKVVAGQQLVIKLDEYVQVRRGHTPRVTFADNVQVAVGGNGDPLVQDEQTLVFTSEESFNGMTSLQFEVTDGSSPDDLTGLKATLSLPIEVQPNPDTNHAPEVHPSQVTAAAGEPATEVDLGAMIKDVDDPQNAQITVKLGAASDPFKVSLDGLRLSVSAPVDAQPGTPGSVAIEVSDGKADPVSAAIPLQVVSSTRPLLSIAPIAINNANAGQASAVDLTPYVTNPYASDGKPFHVVGEPSVTVGQGTASVSGQTLTVTPSAGFNGQLVVSFRLGDATNDPAREVAGTVTATVRDKPGPPVNVTAQSTVSKTADVSWSSGPSNGAPISGFQVRWTGDNGSSGSTTVGQVTSANIAGLTNNVWYTFTVIATNEVGDSEPSAASNQVRPDAKPNQVGTPTAKFGDKSIAVSWPAGTTEGAPIARYDVTVSPAAGASTREVTGTSVTWDGLTNGTAYTFTVVAVSVNNLVSDPSPASAPETPAGVPAQPAGPRVVKDPASAIEPSATVSWTAPNGNGDDAGLTYELRQSGGATVYSGAATSTHVSMAVSTSNQTFEVRATNKSAQWSPWSPVSNAVRPFQPPAPVSGLSVTPTGANNTVSFNFSPGALNGAQPGEVSYRWTTSTGGSGTVSPGAQVTAGAFPNGTNVNVTLYPVSVVNGETSQGDSASASVNAYGPPQAPSVSAQGNVNNVTLNWNAGGSANGRSIVGVETSQTSGQQGVSGSVTVGSGRNESYCIRARAVDNEGHWGAWSGDACASTWGSPSYRFTSTGRVYDPTVPTYYARLTLERYDPNSNVYCWTGGVNYPDWSGTYRVDGNGNWSGDTGLQGAQSYFDNNNLATCRQA